jgi:RNA polymerase sigma factor (sigma-70 family)
LPEGDRLMLEDKVLIWKFNCGNRDVLRYIYEKYKDDLVTLAAALLCDVGSAEDAVHDAFVSLIERSSTLRLTRNLKAYLATCVANNARNRYRAKQRRKTATLDDAAIFGEEMRHLSSALAQLPYEQREVVILRLYSGMKFRAIARAQATSVNTVQGRYRYALYRMRSMLDAEVKK